MSEEDNLIKTAMIEFGLNFARYVKEMDLDLWNRAVAFAKDNTDVEGVSFSYPDEKREETPAPDWWDDWFTNEGTPDEQ